MQKTQSKGGTKGALQGMGGGGLFHLNGPWHACCNSGCVAAGRKCLFPLEIVRGTHGLPTARQTL